MSNETRCEPPPEWRDRDGWHWVQTPGEKHPRIATWHRSTGLHDHPDWKHGDQHSYADVYLAPVTPPAIVAALVEALEAADQFIRNGIEFGFIRMPNPDTPDPALETPGKVAQALAAYREAGR